MILNILRKKIKRFLFSKKQVEGMNCENPKVILLDVPNNGNMGDQAIVLATEMYYRKVHPNCNFVEITNKDMNSSLKPLKRKITSSDVILWNGGGNIGDLYPDDEVIRWATLKKFKRFKTIIFPQTVYFKNGIKSDYFRKSVNSFKYNLNLLLFVRERRSKQFVEKFYTDVHVHLVPDIVFSLENNIPEKVFSDERTGVLTLLRSDIEKSKYDLSNIYKVLNKKKLQVNHGDTFIKNLVVTKTNRKNLVFNKLQEIARHKMVITDRLHGMIFAYLTHTPALVIENNNWKIRSTYETWLKKANYIELIPNNLTEKGAKKVIDRLYSCNTQYIGVSNNFEPLRESIE